MEHSKSKKEARLKKIADILALVNGETTSSVVRSKKQLLAIDWGDDGDGSEDTGVFMIGGKKVNRATFQKELSWREENKK
jgi:hypothetical protein